ncbi:ArsR family transcriptional regulator [Margalitia sp. FSL K6-0131]|uniref:ArsR/SmtB family transcription factor n=1 Tax=Margalitia sp. FSL K6-0131 TaxID=2954604 RepID=UPI0030F8921D
MQLDISESSLPVFEALASPTRLKIIHLLSQNKMNIKKLANELQMSSAIVTRHIKQLEEANIIKTEKAPGKSGLQKVSSLAIDNIKIQFPIKLFHQYQIHKVDLPVGHYTDYQVTPTCGLATLTACIGKVDEPKYFMDAGRMDARIIWFTQGYLEYKIPNLLQENETPHLLEISLELASEFPFSNNVWPSDITFFINNKNVGTWTCPGNFSDIRGKYNPDWWDINNSQYGLLKYMRISEHGTFIDGEKLSDVTLDQLSLNNDLITFRIAVLEDAKHVGGATIFGKGFGNYDQDIEIKLYYSNLQDED